MKITFDSDLWLPPVSKAISVLTDGAKVCIDDIHYDPTKKTVEMYMRRKEIVGFEKALFGEMQPLYSQTWHTSLLLIRQVEELNIKVDNRLVTDCGSCFTILFGLKLDGNLLYLGSVEEIQGNNLCEVHIKVKELSIEFSDQRDNDFLEKLEDERNR